MDGGKIDDVPEPNVENDESGRGIRSGLADEGRKDPNSTSNQNTVVQ